MGFEADRLKVYSDPPRPVVAVLTFVGPDGGEFVVQLGRAPAAMVGAALLRAAAQDDGARPTTMRVGP